MKYKFKFLFFIFFIFLTKNIYCLFSSSSEETIDLPTTMNIYNTKASMKKWLKENFLMEIKFNNIENVKKMIIEYKYLASITHPISPIIYAIGIENPSYEMIYTLIELHCDINPNNPEFKPTLIYVLAKIYSANTLKQQNYLLDILKLLLENGAIVTEEIVEKCYNSKVKKMLLNYFEEIPTHHCSLM